MKSRLIFPIVLLIVAVSVSAQQRNPKSTTKTGAVGTVSTAATPTITLSPNEQVLLNEINIARANPSAYIAYLEQYRKYYKDKVVNFPDGYTQPTNEGVTALNDAITFLRTVKPLPPYQLRTGMISGAKIHLDDMLKTHSSGHRGSDGSKPEDRLNRFGMWDISVGENIVYESRLARNDLIGMIIDDGVSNRGHRRNIFSPQHTVVGIAGGQFEPGKTMYVLTFAGKFTDKPSSKTPTAIQY
jgi:uncharacterized protein YkwD